MPKFFDPVLVWWFKHFYIELEDKNGKPIGRTLWQMRPVTKRLLNTLDEPDPLNNVNSPERRAKVQQYAEFYDNPLNTKTELSPFKDT